MRRIAPIRSLLFLLALLAISAAAFAQFSVSVSFAPPELPVYEQPLCPGDGYIWTPGYWAYSDDGYYWVPGTWVEPPRIGLLWTPAYWGWGDGGYRFYEGYWGSSVGFYGGINYGYGYGGEGYEGGRWQGNHFYYNRSVNNVNVTINRNVYNAPVRNQPAGARVSFNGGRGGVNARPTSRDQVAAREKHTPPVAAQIQHVQAARATPELRATANHGKPSVAATPRPGAIHDRAVVPAKQAGAPHNPPTATRAVAQPKAEAPATRLENSASSPAQRNSRPETKSAPLARSNNQPGPSRNQPAQRSQAPAQSERSQPQHPAPAAAVQRPAPREQHASQPQHAQQPQHTPPAAAARPAERPQQQQKTEEKKQGEQPKREER
jgi:hypothetical protein